MSSSFINWAWAEFEVRYYYDLAGLGVGHMNFVWKDRIHVGDPTMSGMSYEDDMF